MRLMPFVSLFAILALFAGCSMTKTSSQTDPDQQVIDQLEAAGSDLNRPHKVEFFLYFPSEDIAKSAAEDLKDEDLTFEIRTAAMGPGWLCLGTKEMVPKHSELVRLRRIFEALAKRLNGEYDGWETAVVK